MNLLSAEPNLWLQAWAENINVAIALMSSDYSSGLVHGQRAIALSEQAGVAVTLRACLANYGNLLCLGGRFEDAIGYFEQAMSILPSFGDNANGAIDAIASIRLTQNRLDEAEELLERIEESIRNQDDRRLYVFRHASLTRIKCLMLRLRWQESLNQVDQLLNIARETGDHFLQAKASLTRAEILLHTSGVLESMQVLCGLVSDLPGLPSDFHGRYEGLLASALTLAQNHEAAHVHGDRARRIFTSLHNISALQDLERRRAASSVGSTSRNLTLEGLTSAQVALQGAAALLVHVQQPEFIAREIIRLAIDTGCVTYAVAVATAPSGATEVIVEEGLRAGIAARRFDVGVSGDRRIEVALEVNSDIESTATANAISLLLSATRELNRARVERENHIRLWPAEDLVTESAGAVITGQMQKLISFAQRVARTKVSVLITGESGTGKEILARAIHGYSGRADKPFVPFNCTAIPREMLESQLFGHRRGAFTGADRDSPGLIRSAKDGTLFLDEIGELSLDLQPKLLRFLESGEICPLGEPTPFTVDVRIVAATNSNVEQLVHDGRFREDLFYRLNVIRLTIPPLRERRDEIPALVHHFVARAAAEFSKGRVRLAEETMEHLLLYPWPGNVRQLQNELRRMTALAETDALLTPAALAPEIRKTGKLAPLAAAGQELAVPLDEKLMPTLARIEGEMIKVALRTHHGRVDAAAKALGISRKGLYLKRQRLGL
jgi:DNA-binding NtrC family response regulator/tetratricopeptide (TPR) repeat protein